MIRHQFGQVEFASEHWFRLAASTIASLTRAAGIATPAKPVAAHVRRIDLVAINERLASLVVVLREGAIKQALVTLDSRASDQVDADGRRRASSTRSSPGRPPARSRPRSRGSIRDQPARRARPRGSASGSSGSLREYDTEAVEEVFSDGLLNVMGAPEFAHSDKLRRVFAALENRAYLGELVGSVAGVRRRPGLHRPREPAARHAGRRRSSWRRMAAAVSAVGVVGVLGPTRMAYRRRSARSASCPA